MKSRLRRRPNGEALSSLVLGAPALALAVVVAASLAVGGADLTQPGWRVISYRAQTDSVLVEEDGWMVRRSTQPVLVADKVVPAWWNAPGPRYFLFLAVGLSLALLGIALGRKRGATVSYTAFAVHLALLGIGLLFSVL